MDSVKSEKSVVKKFGEYFRLPTGERDPETGEERSVWQLKGDSTTRSSKVLGVAAILGLLAMGGVAYMSVSGYFPPCSMLLAPSEGGQVSPASMEVPLMVDDLPALWQARHTLVMPSDDNVDHDLLGLEKLMVAGMAKPIEHDDGEAWRADPLGLVSKMLSATDDDVPSSTATPSLNVEECSVTQSSVGPMKCCRTTSSSISVTSCHLDAAPVMKASSSSASMSFGNLASMGIPNEVLDMVKNLFNDDNDMKFLKENAFTGHLAMVDGLSEPMPLPGNVTLSPGMNMFLKHQQQPLAMDLSVPISGDSLAMDQATLRLIQDALNSIPTTMVFPFQL